MGKKRGREMFEPAEEEYPNYQLSGQSYNLMDIRKVAWKGRKTYESMYSSPTWTIYTSDGKTHKVDREQYCHENEYFSFWMAEIMFPG